MHTIPRTRSQVIASLRARSADGFIIRLAQAGSKAVVQDAKPLQRPLSQFQELAEEGNETMCGALWQLMDRS